MATQSGQLVKKADQRVTVRGWFEAQKGEIARAVPKHIDPERLDFARRAVQRIVDLGGYPAKVEATLDRAAALVDQDPHGVG